MKLYKHEGFNYVLAEAIPKASGLLFTTGEHIFLIQRSAKVTYPGYWSLPGGYLIGNDLYESAIREAKEELGHVPEHRVIFTFEDSHTENVIYTTYICYVEPDEAALYRPTLNWESSDWFWAAETDLKSLRLHPGLELVLDKTAVFF